MCEHCEEHNMQHLCCGFLNTGQTSSLVHERSMTHVAVRVGPSVTKISADEPEYPSLLGLSWILCHRASIWSTFQYPVGLKKTFYVNCRLTLFGSFVHQGKKLPPNIDENAEEGDVSDEDSADEMEDDCKLMNGDVCILFVWSLMCTRPEARFVSWTVNCTCIPDGKQCWVFSPVLPFPPYVYLLYYSLRCLLLSLSFCVAICSHVLLFSLPVCLFSFSSTVACFFQSGRYCMNSSFSTTSEISPSHVAILSHPACESWKRSAQNHFASLGCFIECVRIVYLEPIRPSRSDVFRI